MLFPILILICLIGTYSMGYATFDLWVLFGFGNLGYIFRKLAFDLGPLVLAMVIGPMTEMSFRQALMLGEGSFSIFFQNPIAFALIVISFLLILLNFYRALRPSESAIAKSLEEEAD
jgi:putative tricarboxylic transport membrane protein